MEEVAYKQGACCARLEEPWRYNGLTSRVRFVDDRQYYQGTAYYKQGNRFWRVLGMDRTMSWGDK